MYSSKLFALTLAIGILLTLDVAAYTYGGGPLCAATSTASAFALIGWLGIGWQASNRRPVAFNWYVASIVSLVALYGEQWARGFSSQLVRLFPRAYPPGVGISEHAFVAVFPLAGSATLLLGALAYYHGSVFGRFAAWFTFAWSAVAAIAVYAYPLFGAYGPELFPGSYTAPLPLVIAIFGIRAMQRGDRLQLPETVSSLNGTRSADLQRTPGSLER